MNDLCVDFLVINTCILCLFSFTPDFTMSRVRRILSIHTSLGPTINYTLQASIPSSMLGRCSSALPRPWWEPFLYYSAVCFMVFLLLCILGAAYLDAERIFRTDLIKRRPKVSSSTQTFDKAKVFDLKSVAGIRNTELTNSATSNHTRPPEMLNKHSGNGVSNGHIDHGSVPLRVGISHMRKHNKVEQGSWLSYAGSLLSLLWSGSSTSGSKSTTAAHRDLSPPTPPPRGSSQGDHSNRLHQTSATKLDTPNTEQPRRQHAIDSTKKAGRWSFYNRLSGLLGFLWASSQPLTPLSHSTPTQDGKPSEAVALSNGSAYPDYSHHHHRMTITGKGTKQNERSRSGKRDRRNTPTEAEITGNTRAIATEDDIEDVPVLSHNDSGW